MKTVPEGYIYFDGLITPEGYVTASEEVRKLVVNGCGTGGWKGKLIPDNLYGLDIEDICDRHDWGYQVGDTEEDKKIADSVFLRNLKARIMRESKLYTLRKLRLRAAQGYYEAVEHGGNDAFWANKRRTI